MENKEQNTGMSVEQAAEQTFPIPDDKIGDVYFCSDIANLRKGFRFGASWQSSKPINSGWVSVEDRLPESLKDGKDVIVYFTDDSIGICLSYLVSHLDHKSWMPLPQPPKQ